MPSTKESETYQYQERATLGPELQHILENLRINADCSIFASIHTTYPKESKETPVQPASPLSKAKW